MEDTDPNDTDCYIHTHKSKELVKNIAITIEVQTLKAQIDNKVQTHA